MRGCRILGVVQLRLLPLHESINDHHLHIHQRPSLSCICMDLLGYLRSFYFLLSTGPAPSGKIAWNYNKLTTISLFVNTRY